MSNYIVEREDRNLKIRKDVRFKTWIITLLIAIPFSYFLLPVIVFNISAKEESKTVSYSEIMSQWTSGFQENYIPLVISLVCGFIISLVVGNILGEIIAFFKTRK